MTYAYNQGNGVCEVGSRRIRKFTVPDKEINAAGGYRVEPVPGQLPKDYELYLVGNDRMNRGLIVHVVSPEFDEVPEGCDVPDYGLLHIRAINKLFYGVILYDEQY